ncbi:MAG: polysaccharide pyruvyl transferase family protein [Flavobacteriaceae bacterium]|nr:polysaccharide pyruvyl transferase family protein [Flavobacteriaceae bacterium]
MSAKLRDLFAVSLVKGGFRVVYFTNGDPGDEKTKEAIEQRISDNKSINTENIKFLNRLLTPSNLVTTISQFDAVVAHRLHANILSYSMKITHVVIGWSVKMASFFESVGRSEYFIEADKNLNSEVVFQRVLLTLAEGIDEERHNSVIQQSKSGIDVLINEIRNTYSKSCVKEV